MVVRDAMTRRPETLSTEATLQDAAMRMKQQNIGILPVVEDGQAVGVLTDRDLALRGLEDGRDPRSTRVREIMTTKVVDCLETTDIRKACELMETHQIRRLVVTDKTKKVVGLLSLDDLAKKTMNGRLSGLVLHHLANMEAVRF